jgi:hypothetical protein
MGHPDNLLKVLNFMEVAKYFLLMTEEKLKIILIVGIGFRSM